MGGQHVVREQRHGYVFEVSASATGLVEPVPIKAMGRFEHEACAVHEATGIVYMTEDRQHSLFYRYIPNVPGKLLEGGRLQALAVVDEPSLPTHNWTADHEVPLRQPLEYLLDRSGRCRSGRERSAPAGRPSPGPRCSPAAKVCVSPEIASRSPARLVDLPALARFSPTSQAHTRERRKRSVRRATGVDRRGGCELAAAECRQPDDGAVGRL